MGLRTAPAIDERGSVPDEPAAAELEQFRDWLVAKSVFVRIRKSKGRDLGAACGQLGGGENMQAHTQAAKGAL